MGERGIAFGAGDAQNARNIGYAEFSAAILIGTWNYDFWVLIVFLH